ncbi:acyltransferase [Ktedonospora formicarum]|uniref:Acyltransferase n=1 Tax=Ktedonospora formicarum TaxID=2778364 RepID=A0A8J3HZJ3_9CHLR|nr:acyltransferase [Ktedonospora formicarum]
MFLGQSIIQFLDDGKQKSSIKVLDGVRAVACLSILIFHVNVAAQDHQFWLPLPVLSSWYGAVALSGQSGVILFFLLSGFLLFLPYAKALLFESTWPSFWQFYVRRVFRIVPAYYVALFLMICFFHPEYLQVDKLHDLWLFLTFRMDAPETFQQLNGPFWTLAVEFQFYLLLPLFAWIFALFVRRGKVGWRMTKLMLCLVAMMTWGVISLYCLYVWLPKGTLTPFYPPSVQAVVNPYLFGGGGKFLEVFAMGMLICMLYTYLRYSPQDSHWNQHIRRFSVPLFLFGLAISSFMVLWHFYAWDQGHTFHLFDAYRNLALHSWNEWEGLCYAIGFGLCLLALLYAPIWLKRPFEWSPLRWIGLISFSLYMWHDPLIALFVSVVIVPLHHQISNPVILNSLVWVWVCLVIIPFSCLLYLFIEKPGMRLGEKIRQKLAKQPMHQPLLIPVPPLSANTRPHEKPTPLPSEPDRLPRV